MDKTARGRLRFDGADRAAFLQALLTNEVAEVQPGAGTYALYLTPQGRIIADLHLFVRPDCLIADVPAASAARLVETFDRVIFTEDVRRFYGLERLWGDAPNVTSEYTGESEPRAFKKTS